MPTRIYTEETIKKRKILSGDEKPTRKYTKAIKQEIKKEPMEMSDGDIDDDDVMDIEEADGTLPKKIAKMNAKQKRVMKTKKLKKVPKVEKDKEGVKVKPKRRKKPPVAPVPVAAAPATTDSTTPAKTSAPVEATTKPVKKVPKVKEKKVTKPKPQKPAKKPTEKEGGKESDSDSSVEESEAYETCGVAKCQRPSGEILGNVEILRKILVNFFRFPESVQDWILCDGGCEVWYHMLCVGLKIKEVKPDMEFICNNCKKRSGDTSVPAAAQK